MDLVVSGILAVRTIKTDVTAGVLEDECATGAKGGAGWINLGSDPSKLRAQRCA